MKATGAWKMMSGCSSTQGSQRKALEKQISGATAFQGGETASAKMPRKNASCAFEKHPGGQCG